ncbi:hypothetical protein JCM3765_007636 [Sporobolomyces pararoseus]
MPNLSDLPPELILSIFFDPQLDYKDLKCISRVNKPLHEIEQDPRLNSKLFRKGLPPSTDHSNEVTLAKTGAPVKFHPILNYVDLLSPSINEIGLSVLARRERRDRNTHLPTNIIQHPCMNEYATSPPCRRIVWKELGIEPPLETTRTNGVTVKDVLVDMIDKWNSYTSDGFREGFMRELRDWLLNEEIERKESELPPNPDYDGCRAVLHNLQEGHALRWRETILMSGYISRLWKAETVEDDLVHITVIWENED